MDLILFNQSDRQTFCAFYTKRNCVSFSKTQHNHFLLKMNIRILLNSLLFLFFLNPAELLIAQQENQTLPVKNADIVVAQINELLSESQVMGQVQKPFQLTTNFPDQYMNIIFQGLVDNGKMVSLDAALPSVRLRLFPENVVRQVDKHTAERILSGELQILLTDEDSVVKQTETLQFSYIDTFPVMFVDDVESNWQGGAFQVRNMHKKRNIWKRAGQPAIVAVATGVTVFLLFNIRSN